MGVLFCRTSAGIVCVFLLSSLSYAQQITLPQPLITPPGMNPRTARHFPAYHVGGVPTDIAPMTLQPSVFPLFIEGNEVSSLVTLIYPAAICAEDDLLDRRAWRSQDVTQWFISLLSYGSA